MFVFITVNNLILYLMIVNYSGVQIFMDFVTVSYPQKLLSYTYTYTWCLLIKLYHIKIYKLTKSS